MARLVHKIDYPACLAGQANGELDARILRTLDDSPDVRLVEPAMRSWLALRAAAAAAGFTLRATSLYDSYRPLSVQRSTFYDRYQRDPTSCGSKTCGAIKWYKICGNATAACPGTSNHGYGLAVDVANASEGTALLAWLEANVYDYGWSWELPIEEPWHIRYCDGDAIPAAVLAYEAGLKPTEDDMAGLLMMAYDESGNVWVGSPGGFRQHVGVRAGGVGQVPTGWSGDAWSVAYWHGRVGSNGDPKKTPGSGTGMVAWRTDRPNEAGPRADGDGLSGDVMCGCPFVTTAALDSLVGVLMPSSSSGAVGAHEHTGGTSGPVARA